MYNNYNKNNRNNRSTYNYRSNNRSYDKSDNRTVNSNESNAIGVNNNKPPLLLSNYNAAIGVPAITSLVTGLSTGHPILGTIGMIPAAALGDVLYYKYNKRG